MTDWKAIEREANILLGLRYSNELLDSSSQYIFKEIPFDASQIGAQLSVDVLDDLIVLNQAYRIGIAKKYDQSKHGREKINARQRTPKYRDLRKKYLQTDKGKAAKARSEKKRRDRQKAEREALRAASGTVVGIRKHSKSGKFAAFYKEKYLGLFKTKEEASEAIKQHTKEQNEQT